MTALQRRFDGDGDGVAMAMAMGERRDTGCFSVKRVTDVAALTDGCTPLPADILRAGRSAG
jgi:hypothetical protein